MTSRKFIISCVFAGLITIGLFTKFISDGNFIAGMGIVVGMYNVANVIQHKIEGE